MPETEGTQYDVPIPLRDNESPWTDSNPNPHSRLEAVAAVTARMLHLSNLLLIGPTTDGREAGQVVDRLGVVEVVDELQEDLYRALTADAATLAQIVRDTPLAVLTELWTPYLWPPGADAAGPERAAGTVDQGEA